MTLHPEIERKIAELTGKLWPPLQYRAQRVGEELAQWMLEEVCVKCGNGDRVIRFKQEGGIDQCDECGAVVTVTRAEYLDRNGSK